jgi:hypothetical protein
MIRSTGTFTRRGRGGSHLAKGNAHTELDDEAKARRSRQIFELSLYGSVCVCVCQQMEGVGWAGGMLWMGVQLLKHAPFPIRRTTMTCPVTSVADPDPGSGIRLPGYGIRYPGYGNRYPGYGIRYPGYGIRFPGYGIRYPLSGIRDKVFSDPDQTHIFESSGNKFLNDEQFKIKQQL